MGSAGMASMIAPGTSRDDVLRGVGATICLRPEMFSCTAKILGQPNGDADFLGELLAALLPHKKPAIEALAVLV